MATKITASSFSLRKFFKYLFLGVGAIGVASMAYVCFVYTISSPQNNRDWTIDQSILPSAEFNGDEVTLRNIRNFTYTSETAYTPNYYDKTYSLNDIVSVDFIVEPLAPIAIAHTFISFGFANGDHVAVSVEIRKEKGESFSPLRGLLDEFELMYVLADERDVLQLRALHRKDTLFLYPARITREKARTLFVSILNRVNTLTVHPEFYNTLTNTCTTNIVRHINDISAHRVPWDYRILFPKDADAYAYELGLIDTSLPFHELQAKQRVNTYIEQYADQPDFSQKIRAHFTQ